MCEKSLKIYEILTKMVSIPGEKTQNKGQQSAITYCLARHEISHSVQICVCVCTRILAQAHVMANTGVAKSCKSMATFCILIVDGKLSQSK